MNNNSVDKKSRNRGVVLDPALVKTHAIKQNLRKQHEFEAAYYRFFNIPPESDVAAPKNAWFGKRMDKKYANQVAHLLGLSDFTELLVQETSTGWQTMLTRFRTDESLFEWQFDISSEQEEVWRNMDFSLLNEAKSDYLKVISINSKWLLTLYGDPGEQFAIFLLSDRQTTQIAPRNHPLCKSVIESKQTSVNFPELPLLQFSREDGIGKRTLIVIRAKHIVLAGKSEHDAQNLSMLELEQFSHRLMLDNSEGIAVNTYDFMLQG